MARSAPRPGDERKLLFVKNRMECLEAYVQATLNLLHNHPYRAAFPSGDQKLLAGLRIRIREKAFIWVANPARYLIASRTIRTWIDNRGQEIRAVYARHRNNSEDQRQWDSKRIRASHLDSERFSDDVIALLVGTLSIDRSKSLALILCERDTVDLEDIVATMRKDIHRTNHSTDLSPSDQVLRVRILDTVLSAILARRSGLDPILRVNNNDIQNIAEHDAASVLQSTTQ